MGAIEQNFIYRSVWWRSIFSRQPRLFFTVSCSSSGNESSRHREPDAQAAPHPDPDERLIARQGAGAGVHRGPRVRGLEGGVAPGHAGRVRVEERLQARDDHTAATQEAAGRRPEEALRFYWSNYRLWRLVCWLIFGCNIWFIDWFLVVKFGLLIEFWLWSLVYWLVFGCEGWSVDCLLLVVKVGLLIGAWWLRKLVCWLLVGCEGWSIECLLFGCESWSIECLLLVVNVVFVGCLLLVVKVSPSPLRRQHSGTVLALPSRNASWDWGRLFSGRGR